MNAIHVLLRDSIDYAGLFPPAGLDLGTAMRNYAAYRTGDSAWALGRFIAPTNRLYELEAPPESRLLRTDPPWRIGALVGADPVRDLEQITEFNHRHSRAGADRARVDTVELKATSVSAIEDIMRHVPSDLQAYIEIPIERDPAPLVEAIQQHGGRAKVRTGGVTRDAFPPAGQVVRFLRTCIQTEVPFKATAGLHHALRADYRLTYEANSATGTMFGFLNLFLAVAFVCTGIGDEAAIQILEEGSPQAFEIDNQGIIWRDHRLDLNALRQGRKMLVSFGSCSFTEPIAELQSLQLLPGRVRQA